MSVHLHVSSLGLLRGRILDFVLDVCTVCTAGLMNFTLLDISLYLTKSSNKFHTLWSITFILIIFDGVCVSRNVLTTPYSCQHARNVCFNDIIYE